ncbi:hypothetical protein NA56DRAFT_709308 [Hyaloscypha hepaticicola]|uniref:Uncharacterized protein n=1 Tax=Hyaloscypha hepaticicola TaxID=2082293 RepID=A0A2J6PPJ3_9HELO|nr:hypothetical protein NA56DRAFT_709308 [Hyaloscypha hepaticicola]
MATSYNISELTRIITTLKETKLTLNFKLNLLRSSAGSKLWIMEEKLTDKENSMGEALFVDGDSDKVKSALKEAIALGATFDALGEEVMRFKFMLEATQAVSNAASGALISDRELLVDSGNISNAPEAKKQKFNPAPQAPKAQPSQPASAPVAIKQEHGVSKQANLPHWAPEGYYYVKAHFRRKPKRKAKNAEAKDEEADNEVKVVDAPASVDIVDMDGV